MAARKPVTIPNGSNAEVWYYTSPSGKTLDFYVRPLDDSGDPILQSPVHFRIALKKLATKVGR
jgi:hypothetical protein